MRGLRSFLALLVIAAGLGAYIYFVEMKKPATSDTAEKREKVFTLESDKIQDVEVKSEKGEKTTLKRADGKWQITSPEAAPADDSEVSNLVSSLSTLEVQRVVEEKPADLDQYGLKDARFEIAFKATGAADMTRLLVGRKTPTGGDLYAKVAGKDRVFLIPAYLESSLNRGTFDLRDKRILKIDRAQVDSVEIQSGDKVLRFAKTGPDWTVVAPVKARADYTLVEGVIGRLDDARMSAIVASGDADLKSYGLDKAASTVRLGMGSSQATIAFGKTADDKVYARDLSRPLIFTVPKAVSEDLTTKTEADYRRKDLFEFRPFNASRVEFVREGKTYTFEKTKAKDGTDKWQQTAPVKRDPDATKLESTLTSFANLRAQSFVDSTKDTGLDKPAVTVSVQFGEADNKKREHVAFGQAKDAAYAAPEGEPGAAKVDATELTNALKALDEIIKS